MNHIGRPRNHHFKSWNDLPSRVVTAERVRISADRNGTEVYNHMAPYGTFALRSRRFLRSQKDSKCALNRCFVLVEPRGVEPLTS